MRYISAPIWNHMKRFLLILITAFSFTANAQLKLKLKSGTYEVKQGSFVQIKSNAPTYGVAVWNHAISVEDKKALADLGVEIYQGRPCSRRRPRRHRRRTGPCRSDRWNTRHLRWASAQRRSGRGIYREPDLDESPLQGARRNQSHRRLDGE